MLSSDCQPRGPEGLLECQPLGPHSRHQEERRAPDFPFRMFFFFDIPNSFPVFISALVRGPTRNNLLPGKLSSRPEFLTEGERRVSAGARTSRLAHVM